MDFINELQTGKNGEHALVFGQTRSGKTHFIKTKLLPDLQAHGVPYIIWDPKGEYQGFGHIYSDPEKVPLGHVVFIPTLRSNDKAVFDQLCKNVMCKKKYTHKNGLVFIVDEAHTCLQRHKAGTWAKKIAKQGSSAGKTIIAITQRPQDIDTGIKTQASWVIVFNLSMNDLEHIEKYADKGLVEIKNQAKFSHYECYAGNIELKGPV